MTVSASALPVPEGGSATYTVVLDTVPTAAVEIAVAKEAGGDTDLTVAPSSLTFTTADWNTAQTVTVSAAADDDADDGTATVTHTAASTDAAADGVAIASVTLTESDSEFCAADSTAVSAYSGAGIVTDCNTLLGLMGELRGTASLVRGTESLNWSADTAMALWNGVTVSGNRVAELDLGIRYDWSRRISRGYGLNGSIPSELGQLTSLTVLSLSGNELSGSIPPALGQLTSLTGLYLNSNQLSGSIPPALGQLTSLTGLYLYDNELSGSIPSELGQLTSLTDLRLDNNELSGSIPSALGQLTSLKYFYLHTNQLTGCIPVALRKFESDINPQQDEVSLPVCLAPPTGLSATAGDGQVTLSWTAPDGTVTKYQFRQSSDGGSTYGAWTDASGAATTHTVTGLTNGVAYTFQVRAVNAGGNGEASSAATATLALQVRVSDSALTVPEDGTATYTVVLGTVPTGAVTVTVATAEGGDGDLTAAPGTLTFTTDDWSTAQTVTVSAADDADTDDGTATLTHTAASTDAAYDGVAIVSVTLTESDTTLCMADSTAVSAYSGAGIVADCNTLLGLMDELRGTASLNWSADTAMAGWWDITVRGNRVAELDLGTDDLNGSIPSALGQLTGLTSLSLYYNDLSGSIPSELGQLTSLTRLRLYGNRLSGSIPPELGQLTNLRSLSLGENGLSGSIPSELGQLKSLTVLELYGNELSGSIPPELGQLTGLTELWLNHNDLSGSIPSELGQLTSLTRLNLHENELSGSIPPELGRLTSLTRLNLHENELSGSIPSELGQLTSLTRLNLHENELSGSIPPELGRLTSLTRLNLHENELSGSIPPELGQLTSLTSLDLENNRLSGCIPVASGKFASTINPQQGDVDLPVCPAQPTGLGATTDDGQVTLSWTAPDGTVTKYQFRQSSDGGSTYGAWTDASGAATTHTVTGLTNGVAYTFQVRAVNAGGNGEASSAATATPALQVRVSETALTVPEDGSATYTVVLDTAPTAAVTITVATAEGGDADLTAAPGTLTFTTDDWSTAQTVTVSAADDGDADDGTATFTHSANGGGYDDVVIASVSAAEADDDTVGVAVSASTLPVPEGGSATYTLVLGTAPTAAVEVTVAKEAGGDADLMVAPSSLTFTTADWNTAQTVTVSAATDADTEAGTATIAHTATSTDSTYVGLTIAPVTATETDNNAAPAFRSAATFLVAENATTVGTVAAADADDSDEITGYAIIGGADEALFSIVAGTGVLAFTNAPNFEAPTDVASSDPANDAKNNEYIVVVTATGGAEDRALTAVQTLTVTVTDDDTEAPSAPAAPVISAATATGFTVTWSAPANAGPAITDYAVQYRAGTSGTWTDAGHSGTDLTVTLTGLTAATAYQVQVQATNAEGTSAW